MYNKKENPIASAEVDLQLGCLCVGQSNRLFEITIQSYLMNSP